VVRAYDVGRRFFIRSSEFLHHIAYTNDEKVFTNDQKIFALGTTFASSCLPLGPGDSASVPMNQNTLGVLAGVCLSLCAAATAHAVKMIDTSPILNVELTPNERTSVLFDANARPHIPSNPTTGTLIVLVEVGPLFNADESCSCR
jgi:hypothetical protein